MRRRAGDERGSSLIELVVTSVLVGIVALAASNALLASTRATAGVEQRIISVQELRGALDLVAGEVRAGRPVATSAVDALGRDLTFTLACDSPASPGCPVSGSRTVRYRVVGDRLERTDGTSTLTVVGPGVGDGATLRGALVNAADDPVFTYLDAQGHPVPTSGPAAPPASYFRDCVEQVVLKLVVAATSTAGPSVALDTTVTLRNHQAVTGC